MKLVTVQFDHGGRDDYRRLLEVFIYSLMLNMPDASVEIMMANPPQRREDRNSGLVNNTAKLNLWIDALQRMDEDFIFIDCDMLILKDLSPAFLHDFDIAYTTRETVEHGRKRIPINGGVMFVRPNEASKYFLNKWLDVNNEMYMNPEFHRPWRDKYAGMNQSAFGYLLENTDEHSAHLLALPCREWNCCNTEWHIIGEHTRAIHIKSALRRACLGKAGFIPQLMKEPMNIWRRYEILMKRDYPTVNRLDRMIQDMKSR